MLCRSGATAVEYALIMVLVSVAIISGATVIGQSMAAKFTSEATTVSSAP